ncbi:hypothetical protein PENSPDRAFT_136413 [Peniophora sp. CONT]|nr:hypothetical protein PENSPDRAFT_136413 [Peniophora sp. CONT]
MPLQPAPGSSILSSDEDSARHAYGFDDLWNEAIRCYQEETGMNLLKLPFASDLLSRSRTTDEVIQYIEEQNDSFEAFRDRGRKVLDVLKPIVHIVHLFIDAGAEGASKVTPGGKAIFVAVGALLQAANGVSALYDAIELLLQKVNACLARIEVYLDLPSPPNPALMDVLRMSFVQVLVVLGIVTKYCDKAGDKDSRSKGKKGVKAMMQRIKDYSRGFLGESDVEEALKELEELAKEEQLASVAVTHTVVRKMQPKVDAVYDSTVINDLRVWLRPPDPQPYNYERKRKADSCQWFFNDQFENWKMCKNGLYWVYGNAGSGKSVLWCDT